MSAEEALAYGLVDKILKREKDREKNGEKPKR